MYLCEKEIKRLWYSRVNNCWLSDRICYRFGESVVGPPLDRCNGKKKKKTSLLWRQCACLAAPSKTHNTMPAGFGKCF